MDRVSSFSGQSMDTYVILGGAVLDARTAVLSAWRLAVATRPALYAAVHTRSG
jgi:hypothetical protein